MRGQVRETLRDRDVLAISDWHRDVYSHDHGFDATFGDYVHDSLSEFAASDRRGGGTWLLEDGGPIGFIGIVRRSSHEAQLRRYLVDPRSRGQGMGSNLMRMALGFCRTEGYERVVLWTVDVLAPAAGMYERVGFRLERALPRKRLWGVDLVEQRHVLEFEVAEG